MPSNFRISGFFAASVAVLRTPAALTGECLKRRPRSASAAGFCASLPGAGAQRQRTAPIATSTGCERSSTTDAEPEFLRQRLVGAHRPAAEVGTFNPTCTPAHVEFGRATSALAKSSAGLSTRAAGSAANAILPSSRRVYFT